MHRKQRRIIGGILIVSDGQILWLAPVERINIGALIILLAVFIEATNTRDDNCHPGRLSC